MKKVLIDIEYSRGEYEVMFATNVSEEVNNAWENALECVEDGNMIRVGSVDIICGDEDGILLFNNDEELYNAIQTEDKEVIVKKVIEVLNKIDGGNDPDYSEIGYQNMIVTSDNGQLDYDRTYELIEYMDEVLCPWLQDVLGNDIDEIESYNDVWYITKAEEMFKYCIKDDKEAEAEFNVVLDKSNKISMKALVDWKEGYAEGWIDVLEEDNY